MLSAVPIVVLLFVFNTACEVVVSPNNCSYIPNFCYSSENCDSNKICREAKCVNPCPEACGPHTTCSVNNHMIMCACRSDATGHPFTGCEPKETCSCKSPPPKEVKCEDNRRMNGKKKFQLFKEKMNWHQALAYCASKGLSLATIDNQQELDEVINLIKEQNAADKDVWLGATDLGVKGQWVWMTTGKPMNFSAWQPGNPDNYLYKGEVEHCVGLPGWTTRLMNDMVCSSANYVLCEPRP